MKKSTRIKAPTIATRAEFEAFVDELAKDTVALRLYEVKRDEKVNAAQTYCSTEIAYLQARIKAAAGLCEKYADAHRDELLPGKAKSAETPLARYGFRTGNRTLKTLAKWTWEKARDALQAAGVGGYTIRVVTEINKENVLAHAADDTHLPSWNEGKKRDDQIPLASCGLRIVQTETFYIEPKVDGADQVKAGGAS